MADGAACCRAKRAVSGHVPSNAADNGALDAPLRLGLERRDCSRDDERRENCRMNFHVASVSLFNANRRSAFPVAAFRFLQRRVAFRYDADLHGHSQKGVAGAHEIPATGIAWRISRATATGIRLKPPTLRLVGSKVIQPAPGT